MSDNMKKVSLGHVSFSKTRTPDRSNILKSPVRVRCEFGLSSFHGYIFERFHGQIQGASKPLRGPEILPFKVS